MTNVRRLDSPRNDPTANIGVSRADRSTISAETRQAAHRAFHNASQNRSGRRMVIYDGERRVYEKALPSYGVVTLTCHDDKVTFVNVDVKEKVE